MKKKALIVFALCALAASCTRTEKKPDAPTEVVSDSDVHTEVADNNAAPIEVGVDAKDDEGSTAPIVAEERDATLTWEDDESMADSETTLKTASVEEMEIIDAVMYYDSAKVQELIESGINVNAKDFLGNTALMYAGVDNAKVLIQAGADVNVKNRNGFTALMWAASKNATDAVRLLIDAGADVNATNHDGDTALMMTAEKNATDAARLLIDAGADVNATDYNSKTALIFAEERNAKENDSEDMIVLLKAAGAFATERRKAGKYYIGDKGPGGGIVFFYSEKGFPVQDSDDARAVICHYLECSPEELGKITWCPCSSWKSGWCSINTRDGAGAGKLNTARILNHTHEEPLTPSNSAAYACSRYSTETTKEGEWYLPSYQELNSIYENLRTSGKIVSEEVYWSSSQCDNYGDAWHKDFVKGYKYGGQDGKSCHYSVRAVRAF